MLLAGGLLARWLIPFFPFFFGQERFTPFHAYDDPPRFEANHISQTEARLYPHAKKSKTI